MLANNNEQDEVTHHANELMLMVLNLFCNCLVKKLNKACRTLSDQQLKLKVMQTAKEKREHSIEMKVFKTLKDIGIELSLYHGGLLNGKDIKKLMNKATSYFDELTVIIKEGKRLESILFDTNVDALCLHFREVFVLWDGVFLLAQTFNPMETDGTTYLHYVVVAVQGNAALHCTITVVPMEITFMDMEDEYRKYGTLSPLRYKYSNPFGFPISSLGLPNFTSQKS